MYKNKTKFTINYKKILFEMLKFVYTEHFEELII